MSGIVGGTVDVGEVVSVPPAPGRRSQRGLNISGRRMTPARTLRMPCFHGSEAVRPRADTDAGWVGSGTRLGERRSMLLVVGLDRAAADGQGAGHPPQATRSTGRRRLSHAAAGAAASRVSESTKTQPQRIASIGGTSRRSPMPMSVS